MKILQVKEYNKQQLNKYHKDCHNWDSATGGFPQIVFYLFYTNQGNERQYGYVATGNNRAYWNRTKKGVLQDWNKNN
jgi:hypothetical protein